MTTTTTATATPAIATDISGCDDDGDVGNAYLCAVDIVWRRTVHQTVYSANAISLGQSILSFEISISKLIFTTDTKNCCTSFQL